MNGLAGYYVSTIGKPHEYFDLTGRSYTWAIIAIYAKSRARFVPTSRSMSFPSLCCRWPPRRLTPDAVLARKEPVL